MTKIMKIIALSITLSAGVAGAVTPAIAKPTYTGIFGSVAVSGYDVTSYFSGKGIPQKGNKAFSVTYNGATYHFANKTNAAAFQAAPAKYAPQYGGYCAWAMASGYRAPGDPQQYKVVGGKLYLNYDRSVQEKWNVNIAGFIKQANGEWQKIA